MAITIFLLFLYSKNEFRDRRTWTGLFRNIFFHVWWERVIGKNKRLESSKLESLKLESPKLERIFLSWKEPSEVGKNLVKFRDTCSWKGLLKRTRNWKGLSWKESSEVGKNRAKFESFFWSWTVSLQLEKSNELEKLTLKLESVTALIRFIIKRHVWYPIKLCQKCFLYFINYIKSVKLNSN